MSKHTRSSAGWIVKLFRDENGASAIEYGLIAALVSVAIVGGATAIGSSLTSVFNNVASQL